ncbi:MAG: hypothetical protein PHV51_00575 [Methanosarcinaceae archaeon]|nr:hypothetical protein [Methanosarcinaceae archaeon]
MNTKETVLPYLKEKLVQKAKEYKQFQVKVMGTGFIKMMEAER